MISISIITINYNNAPGLRKTMESVFSQQLPPFEYLVIDGGSTDGSLDIIDQYADKISYWASEKDNGIYHAMNKGIEMATGRYLMFLNSGDCLYDAAVLEKTGKKMQECPGYDIYYGDMVIVNDPKNPLPNLCHYPPVIDLQFLKIDTLNHQASFIGAHLFKEFGGYPERYRLAADYWLYLTAFLHDKKFMHLPTPLVNYDLSGISSSANDSYTNEKNAIWKSQVPNCIERLLKENEDFKQLLRYKIIRVARLVNSRYQKLKGEKNFYF